MRRRYKCCCSAERSRRTRGEASLSLEQLRLQLGDPRREGFISWCCAAVSCIRRYDGDRTGLRPRRLLGQDDYGQVRRLLLTRGVVVVVALTAGGMTMVALLAALLLPPRHSLCRGAAGPKVPQRRSRLLRPR